MPRRPSWRRRILILLAVGIVGVVVALWAFVEQDPTWYQPPPADDVAVAELAERVEYRLVEEAQRLRETDAPWTLRLRENQVNAWLSARLPRWAANRADAGWPDDVDVPQVRFRAEGIDVAVRVRHMAGEQILSVRLQPSVDAEGLRLDLERVAVGKLPLPGEPITTLVQQLSRLGLGEAHAGLVDEWAGRLQGHVPIEPIFDLADDRRVRIQGLDLREGWLDLTCETLPDGG